MPTAVLVPVPAAASRPRRRQPVDPRRQQSVVPPRQQSVVLPRQQPVFRPDSSLSSCPGSSPSSAQAAVRRPAQIVRRPTLPRQPLIARAVGAMFISPALQRGESVPPPQRRSPGGTALICSTAHYKIQLCLIRYRVAMSKKHMGSSIDDFLKAEGIFEEAQAEAIKEVAA